MFSSQASIISHNVDTVLKFKEGKIIATPFRGRLINVIDSRKSEFFNKLMINKTKRILIVTLEMYNKTLIINKEFNRTIAKVSETRELVLTLDRVEKTYVLDPTYKTRIIYTLASKVVIFSGILQNKINAKKEEKIEIAGLESLYEKILGVESLTNLFKTFNEQFQIEVSLPSEDEIQALKDSHQVVVLNHLREGLRTQVSLLRGIKFVYQDQINIHKQYIEGEVEKLINKYDLKERDLIEIRLISKFIVDFWYYNGLKDTPAENNSAFVNELFQSIWLAYLRSNFSPSEFSHLLTSDAGFNTCKLRNAASHIFSYWSTSKDYIQVQNLILFPHVEEALKGYQVHPPKIQNKESGSFILFDRLNNPVAILNTQKEKSVREVAAYTLDREFTGIPPTTLTAEFPLCNKDENGAPTLYNSIEKLMGNIQGPQRSRSIRTFFLDDEKNPYGWAWRKIALQDIRFLNCGRQLTDVLITQYGDSETHGKIIPIEHGSCFPVDASSLSFPWMDLPCSRGKFSKSELDYINDIWILDDKSILERLKIEIPAIERFIIVESLLNLGANAGLSAFDIGQIMITGPGINYKKNAWHLDQGKKSFFESVICQRILVYKETIVSVTTELVNQRLINLQNRRVLSF